MYIVNLIRDIKLWRSVAKVTKSNRDKFNAIGFDVDWVGRVYSVLSVPSELINMPTKTINESVERNTAIDIYIKEHLSALSKLTLELEIMDSLDYPENYERLDGTDSILVIFAPKHNALKMWKMLVFLLSVLGVCGGLIWLILYLV